MEVTYSKKIITAKLYTQIK